MKYLFVLLFLVSCVKKVEPPKIEPEITKPVSIKFETNKCYSYTNIVDKSVYVKVLKTYENNVIMGHFIISNMNFKAVTDKVNPDNVTPFDCEAFEDMKSMTSEEKESTES